MWKIQRCCRQNIDELSTYKRFSSTNTRTMKEKTETIETSLLLITKEGKISRVYCPFTAQALHSIDKIKVNERYKVLEVKTSDEWRMLYKLVHDGTYIYSHFYIILPDK